MRIAVMGLFAILTALGSADDSPRSQYETMVREFDTAIEAYTKATNENRINVSLVRPQHTGHFSMIYKNWPLRSSTLVG